MKRNSGNDIIPCGTLADQKAHVDINKVANGLFSSLEKAKQFIELGIKDIIYNNVESIKFADFGGGEGFLAKVIYDYFIGRGFRVKPLVIDANELYLHKARERKIDTITANLESFVGNHFDFIAMRSVNHYNNLLTQRTIVNNVYHSLKPGGYFIAQLLSSNIIVCKTISKILNLPSLGRSTKNDQFYLTYPDEFIEILELNNFRHCEIRGNIANYAWHPEISWKRFNDKILELAIEGSDLERILEIGERMTEFLTQANNIMESASHLDHSIMKRNDGSFEVLLKFPIVRAKK